MTSYRSSPPEVFLRKGVLKIYSKFTGEHPYRSVISIKLLCNVFEITLLYGRAPVNLLNIFRKPFPKSTSGELLLVILVGDPKRQGLIPIITTLIYMTLFP